jgi:hypothetical protein
LVTWFAMALASTAIVSECRLQLRFLLWRLRVSRRNSCLNCDERLQSWRGYGILSGDRPCHKHGLFVGGRMVTTVPSRNCNDTKWACMYLKCKTPNNGKIWSLSFWWCSPFKIKLPLFIKWMPGIGSLVLNQDCRFQFWNKYIPRQVRRRAKIEKSKNEAPRQQCLY